MTRPIALAHLLTNRIKNLHPSTILGARVLGEFGDEPNRYATPKSRKNYAGTSPITRASCTKHVVLARHVRNRHLADAIYPWAFSALTA